MNQNLENNTHRRFNPLTGEWILVSPHRAKRPWQGQVEEADLSKKVSYDPNCYLCAGNKRMNGETNPDYIGSYSFTNDFAAIIPGIPASENKKGLLQYKSEEGVCKVICYSPDHGLTVAEMAAEAVEKVVLKWGEEYQLLTDAEGINHVQIFENKGSVMGCSNPHPHGQIWAQESLPAEPRKKQNSQLAYFESNKRQLLLDYLSEESDTNERIVFENDSFVCLVPFWATWPYETMILPKRAVARITDLTDQEVRDMADAYRRIAIRYDNLFETSFPYSAGIHQAPSNCETHEEWIMHMSFYPPLLRSASVKKFMVGYEMFADPQRDITAEYSAERLRAQSEVHYKQKS